MIKMSVFLLTLALFCLSNPVGLRAETIHQTVPGDAAFSADGSSAVSKNLVEVKSLPDGTKVVRVPGTTHQWGYVAFWFGQPAPAGKAIIRFKVYVDDSPAADFAVYRKTSSDQVFVDKLKIPADAKKDALVDIDIPVDAKEDWSGLILKKFDASDKPSPWIASVSIVLP